MSKGTSYEIPLRPDFMAQLVLPRDLTRKEATRISALLDTLVIPEGAPSRQSRNTQQDVEETK